MAQRVDSLIALGGVDNGILQRPPLALRAAPPHPQPPSGARLTRGRGKGNLAEAGAAHILCQGIRPFSGALEGSPRPRPRASPWAARRSRRAGGRASTRCLRQGPSRSCERPRPGPPCPSDQASPAGRRISFQTFARHVRPQRSPRRALPRPAPILDPTLLRSAIVYSTLLSFTQVYHALNPALYDSS